MPWRNFSFIMEYLEQNAWKTKPSDRFVLEWIKCHLSAKITPRLVQVKWLQPWMITVSSSSLGVLGGVLFAMGLGWLAGLVGGASQILDGVDGQFSRLTGRQSAGGAFWDSILDRYSDNAMEIGLIIYLIRLPVAIPIWFVVVLGSLALIGGNLISYSEARAEGLEIQLGKPTLASKGTRMTVMVLSGLASPIWASMPMVALCYLALHTNVVVAIRLVKAQRSYSSTP
jgi:CDP-diacylglycerol--glycerol-3-phosphate 3-phosphatidyltransferase